VAIVTPNLPAFRKQGSKVRFADVYLVQPNGRFWPVSFIRGAHAG